jgi:hypothetical protein
VKDKCGNTLRVSISDPRYTSGELVHITKNKVPVRDKSGRTFQVDTTDEKYISG